MPLSAQDLHTIAAAFRAARREARSLAAFPGLVPATLEAAYQVQDCAIAGWDDRVAGWKIGGIPAALRPSFGGVDRLVGPVFAGAIQYAHNSEVVDFPVFTGGFSAVEAEIVLRMSRDIPAGGRQGDLRNLVDAVYLGIETAGSPLATINELGPCVVISDFGNNHGMVIGPELSGWREDGFDAVTVHTTVNGLPVGSGTTASLAGGPLGALAFLLDTLAARGRALKAGDFVTTGALTGIHQVRPGDRATVTMPGLGDITVMARPDAGLRRIA